jgi:hypothetical protein
VQLHKGGACVSYLLLLFFSGMGEFFLFLLHQFFSPVLHEEKNGFIVQRESSEKFIQTEGRECRLYW